MKREEREKQPYRMKARAKAAAKTRARILEAATEHFGSTPYDEVSLADIAEQAGITVQTVLRRFDSKEGLLAAATEAGLETVRAERSAAPVGDVQGAIQNLVDHYETWGDRVLMFLMQEQRVETISRLTEAGRKLHYDWVDQVFAPWLKALDDEPSTMLRAKLIATTDVHVWKVLRRDLGFDNQMTEAAIREMVDSLLH
jgi:AcrR family transcriptional regulator